LLPHLWPESATPLKFNESLKNKKNKKKLSLTQMGDVLLDKPCFRENKSNNKLIAGLIGGK